MSKAPPPLLGFNNNVRHRGRIFHIQTEDSGVKFARIMTHLFADGGRIVKSTRTEYNAQLDRPDMAAVVRGMMKEQHKGMFAALRAGDLDELLEKVCGPLEAAKAKGTESVRDPTATRDMDTARTVVSQAPPVEPSESATMPVAGVVQPLAPVADAQAVIESMQALRDSDGVPRKRSITNPNLRKPTPSVAPPPAEAFDLDVASLDNNLPKAPPRSAPQSARPPRKSNPPPRKSRPPIPTRQPPAAVPAPVAAAAGGDTGPGSIARPANRLAANPPGPSRSIFGDGAISEQSLDEVILSYLAEDLEESK